MSFTTSTLPSPRALAFGSITLPSVSSSKVLSAARYSSVAWWQWPWGFWVLVCCGSSLCKVSMSSSVRSDSLSNPEVLEESLTMSIDLLSADDGTTPFSRRRRVPRLSLTVQPCYELILGAKTVADCEFSVSRYLSLVTGSSSSWIELLPFQNNGNLTVEHFRAALWLRSIERSKTTHTPLDNNAVTFTNKYDVSGLMIDFTKYKCTVTMMSPWPTSTRM